MVEDHGTVATMTVRDIAARAPLTSEERARRNAALARSTALTPATNYGNVAVQLSPIEEWQVELAREAKAGRGIDTLAKILLQIKEYHAADADEDDLSDAIQKMTECANRHLDNHDLGTIDAIFEGIFPSKTNSELDAVTVNHDTNAEIQRAAQLPPVQYDRERKGIAERIGMRVATLDRMVDALRPQDSKGQGRSFEFEDLEPWNEPVNGAELLNDICAAITQYIVLPDHSTRTLALWALHTHSFDCFENSPRLAITSPEKGCGKTTTLDVLACIVAKPLLTSNATVSAIFRIIERDAPTLLIDEADTFLKENDELRGILNSGHRRGGAVTRTVGDDHEPRQFSTWAPTAIAQIGRLPDTLNDRSVIVALRRRKPSERVESFRSSRTEHLKILRRKMARWSQDHSEQLAASNPEMGDGLQNRTADNWRPLFAIADVAGGEWPARVREAAEATVLAMNEESINLILLSDIKGIFDGCPDHDNEAAPIDRISSAALVAQLKEIEGRPWAEWKGGKPITANSLARLLGRFEIISRTIRLSSNQTAKGYYRSDFDDVFGRYLPPQGVTPSQSNNDGHCDALQSVTSQEPVTFQKASQLNSDGDCDVVTYSEPRREAIDL
jgi:putative DNA primase/helicase